MNKKVDKLHAPSLAGHFDAPDGYTGHFGWLCGYSADALFLDEAATRFTRLVASQRACAGRIFLAMMLDPGNPVIHDVPGVAHLLFDPGRTRPFRLLHAKVALLGFRHQTEAGRWRLRLLVSTGNWTCQTVEESLDLIWRLDIAQEEFTDAGTSLESGCADVKAAWGLLTWLRDFFDTRVLNAAVGDHVSVSAEAMQDMLGWLQICADRAEGPSRFFDSRSASLLAQILRKLEEHGTKKRSYIALGSGFFESPEKGGKKGKAVEDLVPLRIVRSLQQRGMLTGSPEVDIFVEPCACQALADASVVRSLQERDIVLRRAVTPPAVFGESAISRTLHAKFIFSANSGRKDGNRCLSSWLYLGSGNLTQAGFLHKGSTQGGNLEAGVVLFPQEDLYWWQKKDIPSHQVVSHLLPVQWEDEGLIADAGSLQPGPDKQARPGPFLAPPVAWLFWDDANSRGQLRVPDGQDSPATLCVLDAAGSPCPVMSPGVYAWPAARPRFVRIRWDGDEGPQEADIPVMDGYGRLAATDLPALDLDGVCGQLMDFPMPPELEGEDADGEGDVSPPVSGQSSGERGTGPEYPIRQMMGLLENIAARQTGIDARDWSHWCTRLEQILGQARDCTVVVYFRDKLALNPLHPLYEACFRPSFAEDASSPYGRRYEEALRRIEVLWKVAGSPPLGGSSWE
jgi:hypothetical protein